MKKFILRLLMYSKYLLYGILIQCCLYTTVIATVGNAQKIRSVKDVYVHVGFENATLQEVIDALEDNTEFRFIYNKKAFDKQEIITIPKKEQSVADILYAIADKSGLGFKQINWNISVFENPKKSRNYIEVLIEDIPIMGQVSDQNGDPLPGVSILIKGTSQGTITDGNGNFSLSVKDANAVLVFSFIGYKIKEEIVGNRSEFNIILALDAMQLQELVVTGYQTISEERATGSFEILEEEQLEKPASSIAERLVGMVAGLQSTINPDGTVDFEIRGQSSLFIPEADRQPLIVLDGFAIEGGFSSINPNDVESITVLKDAAAASIWGAKSANGVIVITTKKAEKGVMKIAVSSFAKVSERLDLDYVNPVASSGEVIEYEQMAFDSDFFGGPWPPPSATVSSLGSYSQAIVAMNEARLGRIDNGERDAILNQLRNQNNKSQIEEYLLQVPATQQYNINISGGGERISNSLSLMYESNKGFYKGNETDKFLVNYGNMINVTDWLDFEFSGMVQYNDRRMDGVDLDLIKGLQPYDMLVNEDGSLADMSYLNYYMPNVNQFVPLDKFAYSDWSYNPISEVNNRDITSTDFNTRVQAGLTFKIIEGLTATSRIQYELFTINNETYYNEASFTARQFVNETSGWNRNFNTTPTQNVPSGGILRQNETTVRAYNYRNQLNFVRSFSDRHAVNVVAGSEISSRVFENTVNPDAFGYDDERLTTGELLNPATSASMWNGYPLSYARYFYPFSIAATHTFRHNTDRYFSMYANAGYTFDDKYTVTGSFRTDASNLITDDPKYRYEPFWSAGLGWQVSKESFMDAVDWVDWLNLRMTYGYNGNVDKSTSFLPLINITGTLNPYTEETTATVSSYGNPTLRWEKTNTTNLGVDFNLFNNKLNGTIDVYRKKSIDLIVSQSIAAVNGTTSQKFNNGEMLNKGIELTLGTSLPIRGNDISWSGSINYAYNHNEITNFFRASYQMYDLYNGGTTSYVEGYNANTLWSLRYSGVINMGTEADPNWQPSFHGVGDEKLNFLGWPTGNAIDYESNEGTRVAPVIMGMRHSFKIYDFNLSFIVTGKFGHVFRRLGFNYSPVAGGNTYVNKRYSEVADSDPSEVVPIPESEYRYYFWDRFFPYVDYLTANASHIRFQEVNLTYAIQSRVTEKLGISNLSVYAQGNNLGVILFNDFNEDPEYPVGTLRPQATYTFGLRFDL